jgi:hypothetical protein
MRNIQPVQIWVNGQSKEASILLARIINDDLSTSCTFYYELREADTVTETEGEGIAPIISPGIRLVDGNVSLSGEDYDNWDGSNEYAYDHIATSLNLTIATGSL